MYHPMLRAGLLLIAFTIACAIAYYVTTHGGTP